MTRKRAFDIDRFIATIESNYRQWNPPIITFIANRGATPFEVLAEFFPSFRDLDKFHAVPALSSVPTAIICGTADRITSIGHSRKLHARIDGSSLLECEGAGHMVVMERHDQVNAELDQLLAAAADALESR